MLKGWKTILFNGGLVVATALLQFLAGVDWIEAVGDQWAMVAVAVVNIALRFVTNTPVFKDE